MARVPTRAARRFVSGLKRYIPVLQDAHSRDVNESDTATIVTDLLQDVFGYDKYSEVRSEEGIRGSRCDLAVRINDEVAFLVEIKAVGLDLKENHLRQSVNYAANLGVDWVVLTNGLIWRIYEVRFSKPIDHSLVVEMNLSTLDGSSETDLEHLFLLSREGFSRSQLDEYSAERKALSRFTVGALLRSDAMLQQIRRELRRCSPRVKIEIDDVRQVLEQEVMKREILEGEEAKQAERLVNRASRRSLRSTDQEEEPCLPDSPAPEQASVSAAVTPADAPPTSEPPKLGS